MAAYEGEERLLTSHADVHYYFNEPTPRPSAHRFDKGSYLYLYGNKSGTGARLEIANNVRQPEQDAFTGWMGKATIRQSHKHPTLCTVTVDGWHGQSDAHEPSGPQTEYHWRLPNTDPRNEGKYLFRLHTLDIYFWNNEDAHAFVSAARAKMQPDQVQILDAPQNPPAHEQIMSPVVQQLENIAIQDPTYRNGQTRNSRSASAATPNPVLAQSQQSAGQETPKAQNSENFQPLAYNPAAPAAPEPIKHREKTPPPPDAEDGTGLAGAAYRDHAQTMSPCNSLSRPPYGHPPHPQGYSSLNPLQSHASSYTSPNPSAGYHNSLSSAQANHKSSVSSFPPPPPQPGQSSASPYAAAPSFAPPPHSPPSAALGHPTPPPPIFSAPPQDGAPFYRQDSNLPESPATEILGNSYVNGQRQPLQHLQPQYASYTPSPPPQHQSAPIGGYSDYRYDSPQSQHQSHPQQYPQTSEYNVHHQVYRPTPEEASKHKPSKASTAVANSSAPPARLEQGAGRVDKKVNSFFKKLEKRVG